MDQAAFEAPDPIDQVVFAGYRQLMGCYDRALRRDARTRGVIELAFTVDEQGLARDFSFPTDTTEDPQLRICLERRVSRWRFAPSDPPVDVLYPLEFEP